jgi:hypothetical protein
VYFLLSIGDKAMTLTPEQIQEYVSTFLSLNQAKADKEELEAFLAQLAENAKQFDKTSLENLATAFISQCPTPDDTASALQTLTKNLDVNDKKKSLFITYLVEKLDSTQYSLFLKKCLAHEVSSQTGGATRLRGTTIPSLLMGAKCSPFQQDLEELLLGLLTSEPAFNNMPETIYSLDKREPALSVKGQTFMISVIEKLLISFIAQQPDGVLCQSIEHSKAIFETLITQFPQINPQDFAVDIAGEVILRRICFALLTMSKEDYKNLSPLQKTLVFDLSKILNSFATMLNEEEITTTSTQSVKIFNTRPDYMAILTFLHTHERPLFRKFLLGTMAQSSIEIPGNILPSLSEKTAFLSQYLTPDLIKLDAISEFLKLLKQIPATSLHYAQSTIVTDAINNLEEAFSSPHNTTIAKKITNADTVLSRMHHNDVFLSCLGFGTQTKTKLSLSNYQILFFLFELEFFSEKTSPIANYQESLSNLKDSICENILGLTNKVLKYNLLDKGLRNIGNIGYVYYLSRGNGTPCLREANGKLYRALCELLTMNPFYKVEEPVQKARSKSFGVVDAAKILYRKSTGNGTPIQATEIPNSLEEVESLILENSKKICGLSLNEDGKPNPSELCDLLDHRANLFLSYDKLQTIEQDKITISQPAPRRAQKFTNGELPPVPSKEALASHAVAQLASSSPVDVPAAKPTIAFPTVRSEAKPNGPVNLTAARQPQVAKTPEPSGVPVTISPPTTGKRTQRPASLAKPLPPCPTPDSITAAAETTASPTVTPVPTVSLEPPTSIEKPQPLSDTAAQPVSATKTNALPSLATNPHTTFARPNVSRGKITQPFFVEIVTEQPDLATMLPNKFYIWSVNPDTYVYSFKNETEQKTGLFTSPELNGMAAKISITEKFDRLTQDEKDSLQNLIKTKYCDHTVTPPQGHAIFSTNIHDNGKPVMR